ncbi:Lymphocyte antigen 6K [Lemmus lemmus]
MIAVGSGRGRCLPGVTQTLSRPPLVEPHWRDWLELECSRRSTSGTCRGRCEESGPQTSCFSDISSQKPGLMDTLRTRRPLEMAVLLALLIAIRMSWVPTTGANGITCHACEVENSFNCSNPRRCKPSEHFCVVAAINFYERFYISSKQCSTYCPVPLDETRYFRAGPLQPKHFVAQKPLPFLYARCCRWDLCNSYAPSIPQFKEQPGKASERRYRYTELFLPGFMVLAAPGLPDLSLL